MFKKFQIFTIVITLMGILSFASAKEPTNVMLGFGGGYGMSKITMSHSHLMRHPIYGWYEAFPGGTFGSLGPAKWAAQNNTSLSSWSGSWEFLVGYKMFINDWVGFRTYANIGVQHYKPSLYQSSTDPIGIIDYTINADLLVNFYESELWSIGVLGGLGFGGTSFDKKAIQKYMAVYDRETGAPIGITNIQQHFFNLNANTGLRVTFFQKIRHTSKRVCEERDSEGKRICRVPVSYIGHSFEFNARFNLLPYNATKYPDIVPVGSTFASRPQYKVENPYRFTIRYIIDF